MTTKTPKSDLDHMCSYDDFYCQGPCVDCGKFKLDRGSTGYKHLCDAYVDQDRTIGGDPVGYKCSLPAEWESPEGVLLCADCIDNPHRCSFVSPWGKASQDAILQNTLRRMKAK